MNTYEQKVAARKARQAERAARLQAEADARWAKADRMASAIPLGQPILVGHHSEGRDRRYRDRIDATRRQAVALTKEAADLRGRASAETTAISSDDPDAIAKLEAKLAAAEAQQEHMRAVNRAVRAREPLAALRALGLTEAQAKDALDPDDFTGKPGFPAYRLSNNNAEIRRLRDRIAGLKREAERLATSGGERAEWAGLRLEEADNRLCLIFPGKPEAAMRERLRRQGFLWSPSRGAWVRKTTDYARAAARDIARAWLAEQEATTNGPR